MRVDADAVAERRVLAQAAPGGLQQVACPLLVARRPLGSGLEASFIARVCKGEDPAKVQKDVKAFKKNFTTIQYCFNAGEPAYGYRKLVD